MNENKHYIRLDSDGYIIYAYSDAFEPYVNGDICIEERGGRQLVINGITNPSLFGMSGGPLYRYVDGIIVLDEKVMPVVPLVLSELEELKARVRIAERAAIENSEANQGLLELLIEMEVI